MLNYHRERFRKLTFQALALRQSEWRASFIRFDEGLTLETSAFIRSDEGLTLETSAF